jgi:hypothetical protein
LSRSLAARIAANVRWAHEPDRKAATAPARRGLLAKFAAEVDPDNSMDPAERDRRARSLMTAHMLRCSAASVRSRSSRVPLP